MPVPADILAVERPKNTVVYVYGKNKDRYGVKKRIGCTYKNGKNYPVNGPTIGHIIDGVYVPIEEDTPADLSATGIALKSWAGPELCCRYALPLLDELKMFYSPKDAQKLIAIAILRVCNPSITDSALKDAYDESVLSDLLPGQALSRNSVCTFLDLVGKGCDRIYQFMRYRADQVGIDHHLLVDGTLKSNNSRVNSLSEFSRKAKLKGSRDISVLYAFDLERMEPVCAECFPGNMLDLTAYDAFVKNNGIHSGVLVGDKGFPSKSIEKIVESNPNLHYFNPLKRSSKIAVEYNMYDFDGVLEGSYGFLGRPAPVQNKKVKLKNKDKWLYSFRDPGRAAKEDTDWLERHRGDKYSAEEYSNKSERFGTVVFESDVDLSPKDAWMTYSYRWQIELVMRYYKDALCFDTTRVHKDYSVIGSEFINFLATVITFRLLKEFDQQGLLEEKTYSQIMRILEKGKKVKIEGEWQLVKMNPSQIEILQKLDLLPKPETATKRKRGRPRKKSAIV